MKKHRMARVNFVGLVLALVAGAACAEEPACVTNLTSKGNVFSGKQITTWQSFTGIKKANAYQRIYTALVKDGWRIGNADKDIGTISATQDISFSNGKTIPLNVLIEEVGDGIKVTETVSMQGGLIGGAKSVQKGFCAHMDAIAGK